jgi:hypothetical protein
VANPPPFDPVNQAIQQLEQRQQPGDLAPLTPAAYRRTRWLIAEYITDLVTESERVARRRGVNEIVSETDVEQARGHLTTRRASRWNQLIGGVGAALLGAAISTALPLSGSQPTSPETFLLTLAAAVVGTAMTVLGYLRES